MRDRAVAKKKTAKKTSKKTSASAASRSTSQKKTSKKTKTSTKASGSAPRTVKKTAQKATGTKKTTKKTSKTTKKAPAAKTSSPAAPEAKSSKKPETRKPEAQKPQSAKPETKKSEAKQTEARKPEAQKPDTQKPDTQKPDSKADAAAADKRKGITVVEKKRGGRQKAPPVQFPTGGLLAPGGPLRKPLIPSGPKNVIDQPVAAEQSTEVRKSPFNKRQLEKFRSMLLDKRRELLGDITGLESEALKSADGADPRLGEHLEDQSSDAIDQAVSLDLAAADRRLLRLIDEALERIDNGTYGLCVVTGKPIREERLRELPWASLSIEAARAEERRQMGRL